MGGSLYGELIGTRLDLERCRRGGDGGCRSGRRRGDRRFRRSRGRRDNRSLGGRHAARAAAAAARGAGQQRGGGKGQDGERAAVHGRHPGMGDDVRAVRPGGAGALWGCEMDVARQSRKTMHETGKLSHAGAVDADGHILEPPDLWEHYLEPQYRDRALRIVPDENGLEELEIGGQRSKLSRRGFPSTLGAMGDPDLRSMQLDPNRTYLEEAPFGSMDPQERLKLLDAENVDAV